MTKNNKSHSEDFKNLTEWLCYLESIHPTEIDLGLTRISKVAKKLQIDFSFACVITVAGTNGKGTTCAFLENALLREPKSNKEGQALSQNVAVYSSPHIEHFNERLRINQHDIDDQSLIDAFKTIEIARGQISLSYYEFTTLAAFLVLMVKKPDVIILEVGLGGRLDATNIIDADVAVITSVDIDHQAFLGDNRETIGYEKAGIMRKNQQIVIGDPNAPQSVINYARKVNEALAPAKQNDAYRKVKVRNTDFFITENDSAITCNQHNGQNNNANTWQWHVISNEMKSQSGGFYLADLNTPNIPRDNVATALMVLKQLGINLTTDKVNTLIKITQVAGRTEIFKACYNNLTSAQPREFKRNCDIMLDVGHNPHAGRYLAQKLRQLKAQQSYHRIVAVVSMLADKDIANTFSPLIDVIDDWHIAPLFVPRAATCERMISELSTETKSVNCFDNITQAFKMANLKAESTDLILVFGSFYTVAEIRKLLV